ncbi:MAG: hypothetical protein NC548_45945 [Lachnospiraceae bacterium]|nr:hypothetical protein [Lachnospiraceae bacterium]MCM1233598.1 hypothetical protein [Ruminococcus flavefaciens]
MVIEEHARLVITLPDYPDKPIDISESDIIQNSLSVTSQCVNGNTFGFGCVSPAQLSAKIRIKSDKIEGGIGRYDVYGAEIILYSWFGKEPPEDGGKRGVFIVTSVTKNHDIFTISASDNVCQLDNTAFEGNGDGMGNAVFMALSDRTGSLLWDAVSAFSAIVGTAGEYLQSRIAEPDSSRIPNGTTIFRGYNVPENEQIPFQERRILILDDEQSDNIRDYISWLAEYMGGFVIADKNGEFQFCLFENSFYHQPEILDFSDFQQNTLEIAGFRIYLHSAKVVTEDNYYYFTSFSKSTEKSVISIETVIKNNPFIEYTYRYNVVDAADKKDLFPIIGALLYYQNWIQIRPFSGIYHGNHYLHLGQYIKIRDENGNDHETTITNITWKFRGGQQIKCVGEDSRTLSQARKRSQAIRMGERMKTQINRLETRVTENNSSSESQIDGIQEKIATFDRYFDEHHSRISGLENSGFQGQIDSLITRIESLENGGEK